MPYMGQNILLLLYKEKLFLSVHVWQNSSPLEPNQRSTLEPLALLVIGFTNYHFALLMASSR